MRPALRILLVLPLLLLAGCFLVNDFGEYWKKGIVDPVLEGTWTDVASRKATTLVKRGDHYSYADIKDPTKIKTLQAGDATYLMFKGATAQGLLRYTATKDRMVVYVPNPARRNEFMDHYAAGSKNFLVDERGVRIVTLNESTVKLLEMLAKDAGWWKEQSILEKGTLLNDTVLDKEDAPEETEAPDPFSKAREEYKDVIGKKKGGATAGVPEIMEGDAEKKARELEAFKKMLEEKIIRPKQ